MPRCCRLAESSTLKLVPFSCPTAAGKGSVDRRRQRPGCRGPSRGRGRGDVPPVVTIVARLPAAVDAVAVVPTIDARAWQHGARGARRLTPSRGARWSWRLARSSDERVHRRDHRRSEAAGRYRAGPQHDRGGHHSSSVGAEGRRVEEDSVLRVGASENLTVDCGIAAARNVPYVATGVCRPSSARSSPTRKSFGGSGTKNAATCVLYYWRRATGNWQPRTKSRFQAEARDAAARNSLPPARPAGTGVGQEQALRWRNSKAGRYTRDMLPTWATAGTTSLWRVLRYTFRNFLPKCPVRPRFGTGRTLNLRIPRGIHAFSLPKSPGANERQMTSVRFALANKIRDVAGQEFSR